MKLYLDNMNLYQIANSGQCFRWKEIGQDTFLIPPIARNGAGAEPLTISGRDGVFELSCDEDDWNDGWSHYFDAYTDYESIGRKIKESDDDYLIEAYEFGSGIRILNQNLWETIVSFIISQNNNIKRISGTIEKIAALAGLKGARFPQADELDIAAFDDTSLGLGYRVPYLKDIYAYGVEHPEWLAGLREMDYPEAYENLIKRNGIGPKVANCICLFGLHHVEAFPIDTHVKQILEKHYPDGFPFDRYEGVAGIVQQYMFYHKINHRTD